MSKPTPNKRPKARNAEYYNQQKTQDELYKQSQNNQNFKHLMELITADENIMLAYRNIKTNGGSMTPGTDGKTIKDLEQLSTEELIKYIKSRLIWYNPQPVRRVEIPKSDGKTRPLGIPTISDRLIQQCFLQILEPICEAKFHDRSYGFRPLRSAQNAMAVYYKLIQQMNLHYVVDVDIKGFFDNVSHGKLLRQLWGIGIHDKKVISIISKMLKAEVAGIGFPKKGTPQGGIISPLLANVVLNEMDWWISNQWQTFESRIEYAKSKHSNGTETQSLMYRRLREASNLKEGWLVRYADDFKIVCRTRNEAERWFYAVKKWLHKQLNLDISPEKSKIVNLKKDYSDFLGLKIKAVRKGTNKRKKDGSPKFVVESHISDKALKRISSTAKYRIKDLIGKGDGQEYLRAIGRYNAFAMGVHNYYCMATHVSKDLNKISFNTIRTLEKRLHTKLKRYTNGEGNQYIKDKYGKSACLKEWRGQPIVPLSYVRTKYPQFKRVKANAYTTEGRAEVHKNLTIINLNTLYHLMKNPVPNRSIQYNDNRISKFCGQNGKCAITKQQLEIGNLHCHHIVPTSRGGTDEYNNLMIVTTDVHKIIHATNPMLIKELIEKNHITGNMRKSLNYYRKKIGLLDI